jgi:predicted HTH transcriptional regulator
MIERCREAGLPEPEFKLTDGFGTVIRRKQRKAFEAVGGKITPEVTEQVGTMSRLSRARLKS